MGAELKDDIRRLTIIREEIGPDNILVIIQPISVHLIQMLTCLYMFQNILYVIAFKMLFTYCLLVSLSVGQYVCLPACIIIFNLILKYFKCACWILENTML